MMDHDEDDGDENIKSNTPNQTKPNKNVELQFKIPY